MRRLILLDTDVVVLRGIAPLWQQFHQFGGALLGVGNEQSNLYRDNMTGKNGGVQLLDLEAMRASRRYSEALDAYASGRAGRWIGFLGDQTLYSYMAHTHAPLLYQLSCEWNRQLSMQFGFRNATVHTCSNRCMLLHANFGSLKCVAAYMQLHGGSCDAWDRLLAGTVTLATATKGLSPTATTAAATARGKPKKHAAQCPGKASHSRFAKAGRRYFSDCCTRDTGDARAPKN